MTKPRFYVKRKRFPRTPSQPYRYWVVDRETGKRTSHPYARESDAWREAAVQEYRMRWPYQGEAVDG